MTKPLTKEESDWLSRERDKIKVVNIRFKDKLYDSGKEDEGKTFHVLQVLGMNEDI